MVRIIALSFVLASGQGTSSCADLCSDGGYGTIGFVSGTAPFCGGVCTDCGEEGHCITVQQTSVSDYGNACATGNKVCCCVSPFRYGPAGQRCPDGMWDSGGHSDAANNDCCQLGRGGDTQNCAAPEIYKPYGQDGSPDVCCYTREAINEYFYRPSEIVASWKKIGALDPTHQSCKTVGTEMTESRTENYARQVKITLTIGGGVTYKGVTASANAQHSVQKTWSTSSTWSVKQSVSTTDCDETDVIKEWVENGWVLKWQWSAMVTTMWGDQYETVFGEAAYTPNEAHPPKCVPGYYALGHYPDYQECDDSGARMSSGNQSMEAIIV